MPMLSHSLAYLGSRIVNGVLALASIHLLTRWLNAEEYGRYALALAVVSVASTVLFQWLNVASARFFPERRDAPEPLWRASTQLFVAISGLVVCLAFAIASVARYRDMDPTLAVVVALAILAMGAHGLTIHVANAMQRPMLYGVLTSARSGSALCAAAGLIHLGWGSTGAVAGFAAGGCAAVILFAVAMRASSQARSDSPESTSARELRRDLLRYGLPLSLTYVATTIVDFSDRLMLGAFQGPAAVAAYAAAYDLVQQTMGALMNVFFLAGFPALLLAQKNGNAELSRRHHLHMGIGVLMTGALLTVLFAGASSDIARVMFGVELRDDAARVMPLLAAAIALAGYRAYFLDVAFQAARRTDLQLKVTLAIAATNIAGNLLLIPRYGAMGSATAAVAAFGLGAVLSWWTARDFARFPSMTSTALAALLAAACAWSILIVAGSSSDLVHAGSKLALSVIAYAAVAIALDAAGARKWLLQKLRHQFSGKA